MLLVELIKGMEKRKIPYVLVGGYALAFQGIVRATVDVDLVISLREPHLHSAEELMTELGLTSRIPVRAKDIAQFHEEYRTQRNLIAWSFVDFKNPNRQVDLLIYPPIKTLKSELISVHGQKVRVATKESLLKMKKLSNRPEDQSDIQRLEEKIKNGKKQ